MAKRFKQKFSRVIPSFQSCRSKDPSTLPSNPVPSFLRLPPVNSNTLNLHLPPPPQQPPSKSHHSCIKRHVSSAFISMGCGFRSRSSSHYLSESDHTKSPPPPPEFHWRKEDKWHVVAKIYSETPRRKIYTSSVSGDSDTDHVLLPPPPPPNTEKKKRRVKKKKMIPRIRMSTSSAESGLFSSEGLEDDDINDEETETLVSSSRSVSTDSSSEFNPHLETISESPFTNRRTKKKKKVKNARRRVGLRNGGKAARRVRKSCESLSPARLSRFQWLIPCTVEGKVRESFAVVKKSEDPYEDFKRSMMEMIMEKQMFEEKDLEQLLHCFLSLNSRNHHGVIVEAFSEIWETLFCRKSITYRVSTTF